MKFLSIRKVIALSVAVSMIAVLALIFASSSSTAVADDNSVKAPVFYEHGGDGCGSDYCVLSPEHARARAIIESMAIPALPSSSSSSDPDNRYGDIVFHDGDRDLLALLTFHETRGYGDDGYGVVETVLNRCNDSRFPDTVYEVINQEDQYISSADLWAQEIDSSEALAHCYEIVDDILDNHHYVLPDYYVWYNSIAPDNYDDYMFFGLGNYFS